MKQIKVLVLQGCEICKKLKEQIVANNIEALVMDADDNSGYADQVEEIIGIHNYPIVIIEQQKNNNYLFITDYSGRLGAKKMSDHITLIGHFDSDALLSTLISLNKK